MKGLVVFALSAVLGASCSRDDTVRISGRMENGDSIVNLWAEDSIYTFPLDENGLFSGKIAVSRSGYATLLHNSYNLYLSPGEDLEIYADALNFSASLYFRGSLGGINNYLKEQEVAVFFDKDYYALDEAGFVEKMKSLTDEKVKLLEAKNFNPSFTRLEKERIRYSIAGKVSLYPVCRRKMYPQENYRPGDVFTDFLSSFSLNNEELFGTQDYRAFLLNYVRFQGSLNNVEVENYDRTADYVLSSVSRPAIRDFLLMELIYRYIWDNNGLEGAERLLSLFRENCSDRGKAAYMEKITGHWEKILSGRPAPAFTVTDREGKEVSLEDFRGTYLYLTVWATWCVPCKSELPYLNLLEKEYYGRNIRFVTVAVGDADNRKSWNEFLKSNPYAGLHTFADTENDFNKDYMIISVPRFILIAPDGRLVDSNAPRLSGSIRSLLESLPI